MKKRTMTAIVAGTAAAVVVTRMTLKMLDDVRRYDHLRSLSNEGPVMEETPELLMQLWPHRRELAKDWLAFARALPKDTARYLKIESM